MQNNDKSGGIPISTKVNTAEACVCEKADLATA